MVWGGREVGERWGQVLFAYVGAFVSSLRREKMANTGDGTYCAAKTHTATHLLML